MVGVVASVVLVLGLTAVGVYLLTRDSEPAATNAAQYGAPPDRCTLLDPTQVQSWAGTPKSTEPEKSSFPANLGGDVDGCSHDFTLETINTVKAFVGTDGHAKERHDYTVEAFKVVPSMVTKPISGLGTAATGYTQQGNDKRRIQAGLVLHDNNLYLELRFLAGGTKTWNGEEVQSHLVDVARAIMAKVPKA